MIARLVVHFDVALTSPNARSHWRTRHNNNRKAKLAAREAWMIYGMPRSSAPVDVQIILLRSRELDQDNALAACKGIIDGLFKDCITPDDTPAWVAFRPVQQAPHKSHRADPTVIVEVYERKEEEMRVFDHPNMTGFECPVCRTSKDAPVVLVGVPGTEDGWIQQAEQVHKKCWDLFQEMNTP